MTAPDSTAVYTDAPAEYGNLLDRYRRVSNLMQVGMLLNWDQQVMMPDAGTPARSQQRAALSVVRHEQLVDDELGRLLDDLEGVDLTDDQAANVREIRREHERVAEVPPDLVERLARVRTENQTVWREARADDDFERFAPRLELLRDLSVERASAIDPDRSPYEVLYEDRQPYLPLETVERIFDRLREELPPMIETLRDLDPDPARPFRGTLDAADQRALSEAALDFLGYDWERGRLDTAPHPFMSGNQFDARITTRYNEEDPLDALGATVHEFGHATYQLGLSQDRYGTPLGQSRSSGVHESQSRFWENHVGRTRAFWEAFLPRAREQFPALEDVTVQAAYEAANRIYPDNLIRVEADELTYHLHVLLRTEIDRPFVEGDLPVEAIPDTWNDKMDEYLGIRPETDAEGCLQDIHWSFGFATFQGYTVGSVLAAQLDAAMREDLDLDELIREGEFEPVHEWLTDRIHRQGQRYRTDELIRRATGEPLTAEYFLEYVREKFGDIYGVDL